jgi:hypothetical protein
MFLLALSALVSAALNCSNDFCAAFGDNDRTAPFDEIGRNVRQRRCIGYRRTWAGVWPVNDSRDAVNESMDCIEKSVTTTMREHDRAEIVLVAAINFSAAAAIRIVNPHYLAIGATLRGVRAENLFKDRALERCDFTIPETLNENIKAHGYPRSRLRKM